MLLASTIVEAEPLPLIVTLPLMSRSPEASLSSFAPVRVERVGSLQAR